MSKHNLERIFLYLGLSVLMGLILLVVISYFYFDLSHFSLTRLFHVLPWLVKTQSFTWLTLASGLAGFSLGMLLLWIYENHAPNSLKSRHHIRGADIVGTEKLKRHTLKKRESQITIADVPIPSSLETLHFLIGGRTGTGKTVAIKEMLTRIIPRGDRVIVTDPNGDFVSHFFKQGDVILNPFDVRGEGWSIFNEMSSVYDHMRYARSIIPPPISSHDREWHEYAQLLCAETTKKLFLNRKYDTKELTDWLTTKPQEELKEFLADTAAAGQFISGADKAAASVRFIIAKHIAPHQYLKPGNFSLREWLKNDNAGNLFITWREDMADALRPLISTWLDILCTSILSLPPNDNRRIWIIIDELASLERLNSLEAALTKGRKHGLRIVTGLQSTAQLDHLYGREKAIVLRSCFSNLLILGGTSSDAQTAEDFSRGLGEQDLERIQTSTTQTRQGRQKTEVKQRIKERIVLPSEITNLPPLSGYLSFAGDYPIARVKLKPIDLPTVTQPFQE